MADNVTDHQLLEQAISGDRAALHELLTMHSAGLLEHIRRRVSPKIKGVVSPEDIFQQTCVEVIRDIAHFTPGSDQSFFAWLTRVAENRVRDAARYHKSAKRGGDLMQVRTVASPYESSVADLVELLSAGSHSPSRSAARHEEVDAVRASINALPDDYRRAIELRVLKCLSLEETAAIMGRSPRAVQGLVDRGKKKLRAALGPFSLYR